MIAKYWLEKGISALLLFLLVLLAYLSFGFPDYFDYLFVLVLIGLVTLYRIDINLASIALILLVIRTCSEVTFYYEGPFRDVIFYAICAVVCFKYHFDKQVAYVLVPLTVICCLAQFYWFYVGYNAPEISIYMTGIAFNCWLRVLFVSRVHIANQYTNFELKSITLDYELYRVISICNMVVMVMVIEYLVRHLTPLKPMYIYHLYTYALEIINLYFPFLVIRYLIKSRFQLQA